MAHHNPGPPYNKHVMKVSGLNPKTSEDTLMLFLEAKTDKDVEKIVFSQDRCTAFVTFSGQPDTEAVEKLMKRKLDGRFLQLSAFENTAGSHEKDTGYMPQQRSGKTPMYNVRMMKVSSLHPDTPHEDLTNYLECMADSDVEQITWEPDRCTAFVTFRDDPGITAMLKKLKRKGRTICGRIPELSAVEWLHCNTDRINPDLSTSEQPRLNPKTASPEPTERFLWTPDRTIPELPPLERPHWDLDRTSPELTPTEWPYWNPYRTSPEPTEALNADSCVQTATNHTEMNGTEKEVSEFSKKQVTLTDHVSHLVQNSTYAKTFICHTLHKWGFEVEGMTMKADALKGVNKCSFKHYEKKYTGSIFNGVTPSETLSLMETEFPELFQKVFFLGDDHNGKLYLIGEDETTSEAMQRLEVTMRNRALNISSKVHVKMASTREEEMKLQNHEHIIRRIERGNVEIELSDWLLEMNGDSMTVQSAKSKIQEVMPSVPRKLESVDRPELLERNEHTGQDLKSSQPAMLHSITIAVSELMATALKKNKHILTYVLERFKELGYCFDINTDNTVVVTTVSLSSLERVERFLSGLVVETTFNWDSEAVWYLRSLDSIKDVLLSHEAFRTKVVFSEKPGTLQLVCTNEILPSVELEMEMLRDSFKSLTIHISPRIDVTVEECEKCIETDKGIKDTVKVLVDSKNTLTVFAHCTDISSAKKVVEHILQQKETEVEENRSKFHSEAGISPYQLEYVLMPEDVEDFDMKGLFRFSGDYTNKPPKHSAFFERSSNWSATAAVSSAISEIPAQEDLEEVVVGQKYEVEKKPVTNPQKKHPHVEKALSSVTPPNNVAQFMKKAKAKRRFSANTPEQNKTADFYIETTVDDSGSAKRKQLTVKAYKADITKLDVEVIVSSANGYLTHGAGVSRAIADAAGPELARECNNLLRRRGQIKVTEVALSTAGRLPYKKVFHAVGPMWDNYTDKQECLDDLCCTILRCFCEAETHKMKSMALSSISSGIFRVPLESCVQMYMRALRSFDVAVKIESLKEVNFVDISDKVVCEIQKQLDKMWDCPLDECELKRDTDFINTCLSASSVIDVKSVQPDTVDLVSANNDDSDCVICLFPITHAKRLPCGHTFCTNCIDRAPQGKRTCPICLVFVEDPVISLAPKSVLHQLSTLSGKMDSDCVICLCKMTRPKKIQCGHHFCTECIDQCFKVKPVCPICYTVCGSITGYMPPGEMIVDVDYSQSLPGYEGDGVIEIDYIFGNGTQTGDHPDPGRRYRGCQHTAYLPDNSEGQKILALLQVAWERRLTFTIDDNTVAWNDISHKTNVNGGPQKDGYPDTFYLRQVEEELARMGVTEEDLWE